MGRANHRCGLGCGKHDVKTHRPPDRGLRGSIRPTHLPGHPETVVGSPRPTEPYGSSLVDELIRRTSSQWRKAPSLSSLPPQITTSSTLQSLSGCDRLVGAYATVFRVLAVLHVLHHPPEGCLVGEVQARTGRPSGPVAVAQPFVWEKASRTPSKISIAPVVRSTQGPTTRKRALTAP